MSAGGIDGQDAAPGALRVLAVTAVCVGIAALAAATFVLSYKGIRAVSLQAHIQPGYARAYPLMIDAMLVIALAAVLALRGAGVPSRILSWLILLIVLGAAAGADVLNATGRELPHNAAMIIAAVLPWALVLIAFVLLLAMLRHARLRRQPGMSRNGPATAAIGPVAPARGWPGPSETSVMPTAPPLPVRTPLSWNAESIVPGFSSRLVTSAAAGAAAGATAGAVAGSGVANSPLTSEESRDPAEATAVDGTAVDAAAVDGTAVDAAAVDAADDMAQGDVPAPASDIAAVAPDPGAALADDSEAASPGPEDAPAGADENGQTGDAEDDMPVFHRLWSSPTPPPG